MTDATVRDEKMKTEIQKTESAPIQVQQAPVTPMDLIASAQASGADIETISKYMDLQERYENREAIKEYNKAVSLFKTENTIIYKNKEAKFPTKNGGNMRYTFASLDNVVNVVTPLLAKYGLNHSWSSTQGEGMITVTCRLSHSDGHNESTSLTGPYDTSGLKNGAQSVVSTGTLLCRHALMMLLGLASGDPDKDGHVKNSAPVDTITESQCAELEALIEEVKVDIKGFLAYLKVGSLEELPVSQYKGAVKALEGKRGA